MLDQTQLAVCTQDSSLLCLSFVNNIVNITRCTFFCRFKAATSAIPGLRFCNPGVAMIARRLGWLDPVCNSQHCTNAHINAVQCSIIKCSVVQSSAMQYNTVQFSEVQCSAGQDSGGAGAPLCTIGPQLLHHKTHVSGRQRHVHCPCAVQIGADWSCAVQTLEVKSLTV